MELTQPSKWTLGALFNQIWSTSGAIDRSDVNTTFLQPFANYNLGGGLSVGVSAEATGIGGIHYRATFCQGRTCYVRVHL